MLRLSTILLVLLFAASSCRSLRTKAPVAGGGERTASSPSAAYPHTGSVSGTASKRVYKDVQRSSRKNVERMATVNPYLNKPGDIEASHRLQFKYSLLTDMPVEALKDMTLLGFLDDWYGTPYRYGGNTRSGIDCSAFTMSMLATVYAATIPRTVKEQYDFTARIERNELQQGDLVFFNTRGGISHVGVYLMNNKFAHASTSSGVMISDLDDEYFARRYQGAGRIR